MAFIVSGRFGLHSMRGGPPERWDRERQKGM